MENQKIFIILISIITFFILTPEAYALTSVNISNEGSGVKTNINVETNTGGNTICQNGKCETTAPYNGKSIVCVNGKCATSEEGKLNIRSVDGNTKININNTTGDPIRPNETSVGKILDEDESNIESSKSNNESANKDEEKMRKINKSIEGQNLFQQLLNEIKNIVKNLNFFRN